MNLTWKEIPGHPGYFASTDGRIRGMLGRVLKSWLNRKDGYCQVRLGRGPKFYVHRLVMLTFVGPCPEGHEVDHDDFDKTNNALSNLKYELKAVNNNRWRKHEEDDRGDFADLPEPEEDIEPPI